MWQIVFVWLLATNLERKIFGAKGETTFSAKAKDAVTTRESPNIGMLLWVVIGKVTKLILREEKRIKLLQTIINPVMFYPQS